MEVRNETGKPIVCPQVKTEQRIMTVLDDILLAVEAMPVVVVITSVSDA